MPSLLSRYCGFRLLPALAMLGAASGALAGLYPPAAPPGSAFVRVFNATSQPKISAQIGDKSIPETSMLDASAYVFLPPGSYPAKIGGSDQSLSLSGSRCYTAALANDGIHLFDSDCFDSQLKALLSVYNLIDGTTISLRTTDGASSIIDEVAPNKSANREVNAVKVALAVYGGDSKLADAKPVILERGKAYSLFVTGSSTQPVLIWVIN